MKSKTQEIRSQDLSKLYTNICIIIYSIMDFKKSQKTLVSGWNKVFSVINESKPWN